MESIVPSVPRQRGRSQARRVAPCSWSRRRGMGVVAGVLVGLAAGLLPVGREAGDVAAPVPTAAPTVAAVHPAAAAVDPTPAVDLLDQRLREAALAPFRDLDGRFGVAAKDLATGRTILLNEEAPFPAASLYKLPVMYEVFRLREAGVLRFDESLTIRPEDAAEDLGTLAWPVGTRITVGTALERMITISDNAAAVMLTRLVGAGRINASMDGLGLQRTVIRRDELSTTALDMLRLLELLAEGQAIDPPTSAEMVRLLMRQRVRYRIPALLPSDATVANKTGDWESAAHDVGLVYGPRATYALAFLSDGIADRDAVSAAIARAARNRTCSPTLNSE